MIPAVTNHVRVKAVGFKLCSCRCWKVSCLCVECSAMVTSQSKGNCKEQFIWPISAWEKLSSGKAWFYPLTTRESLVITFNVATFQTIVKQRCMSPYVPPYIYHSGHKDNITYWYSFQYVRILGFQPAQLFSRLPLWLFFRLPPVFLPFDRNKCPLILLFSSTEMHQYLNIFTIYLVSQYLGALTGSFKKPQSCTALFCSCEHTAIQHSLQLRVKFFLCSRSSF